MFFSLYRTLNGHQSCSKRVRELLTQGYDTQAAKPKKAKAGKYCSNTGSKNGGMRMRVRMMTMRTKTTLRTMTTMMTMATTTTTRSGRTGNEDHDDHADHAHADDDDGDKVVMVAAARL